MMRRTLDDAMGGAARGGRRADGDVAGRPEYPLRSQETPHYLRRFKFVHNGVDVYFSEDDVPVADMSGVSPGSVGPQGGAMAGSVGGTATAAAAAAAAAAAGGIHAGLASVGLENGALAAAESPECSDSEMDISGGGRPTSPLKRASVQLEDAKVPSAKKPHHTFGENGLGAGGGPAGPGSTPSESDDADMMNTDDAVVLPSPSASPITGAVTPDGDDSAVGFQDKVSRHVSASLAEIPGLVGAFDSLPEPMKKYAIYRMLQQCDRSTLSAVAGIVVPALRADFISLLPVELSYNILSFLDYKTLCMAAQVSRSWRQIVDSSEWVWRHRLLRDEFTLQPGELERALREGWDYTSWGRSVAPTASISTPVRSRRATDGDGDAIIPANLDHHHHLHHHHHHHHHHQHQHHHNGAHDEAIDESIPPSPGTPDDDSRINVYKAIYRRKHLISRNWMDPQSKPHHLRIRGHGQDVVTCLQFDDDRIVTGSDDHTISVYDTKTGRLRTRFRGHEGGVWALKYYNKNTLISGSTDKTVRVWDIEKEKCTHIFYGHTSTVRCLDVIEPVKTVDRETGQPIVAPKFPIIVTGSRDATLRMWRLPGPNDPHYLPQTVEEQKNDPFFIRCLHGHTNSVRAISGYGDTVVSGSYDTTVRVWTVSTGECKWQLTGHQQRVYSAVIDHKRDRCVSGSMDWLVKVWCIKTGSLLYTLEGHTSLVGLLDLKQSTLVSAAADSTLRVWDPENGKSMHQLQGHQGAITCFQHDENKVVSGSERTLKLWNIKTGQLIKDLLTDLSGIWQVRFDHQRCVAAVKRKDETYLEVLDFDYDPSTKDEVREIRVVTPEDDAHTS